jgi:hypothetical protein
MIVPLTAACLLAAAQGYAVPPDSLYSLLRVEGGWAGVRSADLGPFQINTAWLRTFTLYWRQKNATATYILLRDDGCAGAYAASAIVRYHWQQSGNLDRAIAFYHAGPKGSPAEMARYLNRYHRVLTESFGNRTR